MSQEFKFRPPSGPIPRKRSLNVIRPTPERPSFRRAEDVLVLASYLSPLFAVWVVWSHARIDYLETHADFWNAAYLLLSVLWVYVLPLQRRFGTSWARVGYNFIPILIYLVLLFAQWYCIAAALLLAAWAIKTLLLWTSLPEDGDAGVRQAAKTRICRQSISFLIALLVIPSAIGVHLELRRTHYELSVKELEEWYRVEQFIHESSRDEIYEQAGDVLYKLSRQQWAAATPKQRLEALLKFAPVSCAVLGVPADGLEKVSSGELPEDGAASYSNQDHTITISAALINGANPEAAVKALLCAVYHYHEWLMIEQVDSLGKSADSEYYNLVRSWQECFDPGEPDYIGFADDGSAAETSAHAFAEKEIKLVLQYAETATVDRRPKD